MLALAMPSASGVVGPRGIVGREVVPGAVVGGLAAQPASGAARRAGGPAPAVQRRELVAGVAPDVSLRDLAGGAGVALAREQARDGVGRLRAGRGARAGGSLAEAGKRCQAVQAVLAALVGRVVARRRV